MLKSFFIDISLKSRRCREEMIIMAVNSPAETFSAWQGVDNKDSKYQGKYLTPVVQMRQLAQ